MAFSNENGGAVDWIVNGAISLALHAVIILPLLFLSSRASSTASKQSVEPAPAARTEPVPAPAPAPIPEDERVPGVTRGGAAKPAAPSVNPPERKAAEKTPEAPKPPTKDGAARTESYVVKRGDRLIAIARDCGCSPADLAKLNGVSLKVLSDLKVGQKIKIFVPAAK